MNLFCVHSEMVRRQRPGRNGLAESGLECFRCHRFFPFAHAGQKATPLAAQMASRQELARASRKTRVGKKKKERVKVLTVGRTREIVKPFQRSGTNG